MKHQEDLQALRAWRLVMEQKWLFDSLIFGTAVVQNVILLMRFSLTTDEEPSVGAAWIKENNSNLPHVGRFSLALLFYDGFQFFGVVQLCCCVVTAAIHAIVTAPHMQATGVSGDTEGRPRRWKLQCASLGKQTNSWLARLCNGGDSASRRRMRVRWKLLRSFFLRMPVYTLTSGSEAAMRLRLYGAFVIAAVLGLVHSPFWFSIHLLDLINKSADLTNVFKAVTLNGRSIVMTAIFGLVIIYLYSIVLFAFSQDAVILDNYPDEDIPMCTNLLVCWVGAINEGLRASDLGAILDPVGADEPGTFVFNVVIQFTFWALVITILLNIIFGIIIDTFGELRADHAFKKNHMENTCFVCSIDRFTFDTKGGGFERHIKEDHNMWDYLYLVVYLRQKDPTAYNGWEQHVASKLKADDFSFMPRNTAIVLKEVQEREEAETRLLGERVASISSAVEALVRTVATTSEATETLAAGLQDLKEVQLSTLEQVNQLRVWGIPSPTARGPPAPTSGGYDTP